MCNAVSAIGLGVNTLGSYLSQSATASAHQEMMDAQARNAIMQMNYNLMNLQQQKTDAFDNAVNEISNVRLNSLQINSGVKAAVAETMSGRTANLLVRSAEGDTARTVSSVQDNYKRKANEVDINKEQQVLSTQNYLENLNASAPKMPSRLANFVSFAGDAISAYTGAKNMENTEKIAKSASVSTASNAANSQWTYASYKAGTLPIQYNGWQDFTTYKNSYVGGKWK